MIAGRESCSCPDCGIVCEGRFAGCPVVWSAAPVSVAVRAVPLALGSGRIPVPPEVPQLSVATNGKAAAGRPAGTAAGTATSSTPDPDPSGRLSEARLSEARLSEARLSEVPSSEAVEDDDLRQVCAELKLEVRRLSRMIERLADDVRRSERSAVLREVDGRFEWLTDQLSDRLVILGNEIVAVKRYLEGGTEGPKPTDRL
jgi:hypothetical protein